MLNTALDEGSQLESQGDIATIPPPALSPTMWTESDASTFRVRGATYHMDRVKISSGPSLFKLIAIDLFEVSEPTKNIASHPKNRVFQALQRGDDSWVFLVNIMVPGPPFLCFVVYFLGERVRFFKICLFYIFLLSNFDLIILTPFVFQSIIEEDTPFGRVARPFFYGNDDEFRNNRFKLIPRVINLLYLFFSFFLLLNFFFLNLRLSNGSFQIVEGNMIIKMAVKDTPTLLGNKLKQYYFKVSLYFLFPI